MKRRLRFYQRQGWHEVKVPSKNGEDWLYNYAKHNNEHLNEIVKWCETSFPKGEYVYSLHGQSGTQEPGVKRFLFKDQKHATWFKLKWL